MRPAERPIASGAIRRTTAESAPALLQALANYWRLSRHDQSPSRPTTLLTGASREQSFTAALATTAEQPFDIRTWPALFDRERTDAAPAIAGHGSDATRRRFADRGEAPSAPAGVAGFFRTETTADIRDLPDLMAEIIREQAILYGIDVS